MIILDLDNTISDDGWRIGQIDWSQQDPFYRYHAYHLLSGFDRAGNEELWADKEVVIFTARPAFYAPITFEWLKRQKIDYTAVYMRHRDDHSHSCDLKRRQLLKFMEQNNIKPQDIECAYDDREDVVKMYQDHNVNAQLVSLHNVCAYTKPRS